MALIPWFPPGTDPALTAVLVTRGEVTESQWWAALADRLTTLVLKEPDPEEAMEFAARVMGGVTPDSPQQTGEALVQHNGVLRTFLTLDVMAREDPFPAKVSMGSQDARSAMEETDLEQWLNLAKSAMSESSLD